MGSSNTDAPKKTESVLFIASAVLKRAEGPDTIFAKGEIHELDPDQAQRWYRRKKAVPATAQKPTSTLKSKAQPTPEKADKLAKSTVTPDAPANSSAVGETGSAPKSDDGGEAPTDGSKTRAALRPGRPS